MRIFHKLFLLLAAVSALPLAAASGLLIWRSAAEQRVILKLIGDTWIDTTEVGQRTVSKQAWRSHQRLVEDRAAALESAFETIRRSVQLERVLLEQAVADDLPKHPAPLFEGNELADLYEKKDPRFLAMRGKEPYGMYRLVPGAALADKKPLIDRLMQLAPFFAQNHRTLPWIKSSYVYYDGVMFGYPGGGRFPADYDPRERYWLRKAQDKQRLVWTKMYRDKDGDLCITYVDPVLREDKSLLGAAAIDIRVDDLLHKLFDFSDLPVTDALLLDYKGRVRASATFGRGTKISVEDLMNEGKPFLEMKSLAGNLKPVYQAIRANSKITSGILTGDGKRLDDADLSGVDDLYTYARVLAVMNDDMKTDWYYIVRTPIAPILKPVGDIRSAFSGLESSLSKSIDRQAERRGLQAFLVVAAVLLIASVFAFKGARATARPLVEIAAIAETISQGDFDKRLVVTSKDEVGQAQQAINKMAAELKKGVFLQNTFKRYVAPSVVEQLIKDPENVRLGGDRRHMTVFFSDVSGFTTLAEHMDAEALVELINEYLSAMTLCIFAQEGTIDKYEGDAIVAFWGAPLVQADHATRACQAALDAFVALDALHHKWLKLGLPLLDMRIGLNTGHMVVGNMGSMVKMDYTVLGDAVNLGSRLEGASRAYGTHILLGEDTFMAAKDAIEARELDLLAVKGRKHSVRVYELLGMKGKTAEDKLNAARVFEAGLTAYRSRDWDAAESKFREADRIAGGDSPSRTFLARLDRYRVQPPPPDWRGVHTLTEK
ncbi:MAG: HAMP domain-containing protein [Elusimicrobia bacterium]|nr:HAMP domain-containing protein [Elusimicrobiota bacterium]